MKRLVPIFWVLILVLIGCEASTFPESVSRYKVIFRNDTAIIATAEVDKGKTVYAPHIDGREGCTLRGWREKDSSILFDFATPITKDITLYPSWETLKCSVTFETGTDSILIPAQTVDYGSKATKPANPEKDGFIFEGWSLNGIPFDFSSSITKDTVLKSVWTDASFSVSFKDSETILASYICTTGDEIRIPTPPEPSDGMKFAGWKLEGTETMLNPTAESVTLSYRRDGYVYTAAWTEVPASQPKKNNGIIL